MTHQQVLGVLVVVQHHLVGLAADPRLLVTAKGCVCRVGVVAVDPDPASLNATPHAPGQIAVAGPQACPQPVLGVVGNGQRIRLVLEGGDPERWPEDLLLEYPHLVLTGEDGGLDVEPPLQSAHLGRAAADQHLGPFAAADLHVAQDLVELLAGRLRPHLSGGIEGVALHYGASAGQHPVHEVVIDAGLHQRAGGAGTHFPLIEEGHQHPFYRLVDVAALVLHHVGEVDIGGLAPQLHGGGDQLVGGAAQDMGAHLGRTGKGQFLDPVAGGQRLTCLGAEAVDHVDYAGGQDVLDEIHHQHDGDRGLLGGLEHAAATGRQHRGQLPGGHQQGEVPRDDLADHADGLLEVVADGVLIQLGGRALLSANTACEVAEVIHHQRQVCRQGFAHRFAVLPGFGDGESLDVLLDAIGDAQQQIAALGDTGLAPAGERLMGGIQRQLDIGGVGAGDLAEYFAIHRRDVFKVAAGARSHPLTTDEVVVTGLEADQGTCLTGSGINHLIILYVCDPDRAD